MRIEIDVDGTGYWVDFQDTFTQREYRMWRHALSPRKLTPEEQERIEEIVLSLELADGTELSAVDYQGIAAEQRMLTLLKEWCGKCYLEDAAGDKYHDMDELTVRVLEDLDYPLFDFVTSLPPEARRKRAALGKVIDEQ